MRKLAFVQIIAALMLFCTTSCDDSTSLAPGIYSTTLSDGDSLYGSPGDTVSENFYMSDDNGLDTLTVTCDAWDFSDSWVIAENSGLEFAAYYTLAITIPSTESANFTKQAVVLTVTDIEGMSTSFTLYIAPSN